MSEFIQYKTRDGQRWDSIAYDAYGDPFAYEIILMANTQYIGLATPPGGVVLRLPVIEQRPATVPASSLPPWKR